MEFKSQVKKVLPLVFLIDNSGSMYRCIKELNKAVNEMLEVLKKQESLRAEINISFITFGNQAKLKTKLTAVQYISDVEFVAEGLTPLGGALKIAKEMIEDKKIIPSNAYRPMVILLSDGIPTDDYEKELDKFINQGRSQKCERMALGIGSGYDLEMLRSFTTTGEIFEAKDARNVVDFFKFVTMTIKDKTLSSNPNKTTSKYVSMFNKNEDEESLVKDKENKKSLIKDKEKEEEVIVDKNEMEIDFSIFD